MAKQAFNGFTAARVSTIALILLTGASAMPAHAEAEQPKLPVTVSLAAPFPNPSHGPLGVSYSLARTGRVRLLLLDILGRRIATLVDGVQTAGVHEINWAGPRSLAQPIRPGIYMLQLDAPGGKANSKVVVLE